MLQHKIQRTGEAGGVAASLAASFGKVVSAGPVIPGACALTDGTLCDGSAGAGTLANRPLGVIEYAGPNAGDDVTIIEWGEAEGVAPAAGIAAGTTLLTCNATGDPIAFVLPAAGVNGWTIGHMANVDNPTRAVAAGEKFRMFVDIKLVQG